MLTFDPQAKGCHGPAWLRGELIAAQGLVEIEGQGVKLAERRLAAAHTFERETFDKLLASIPSGAGLEAVAFVPWKSLYLSDGRSEPSGWQIRPSRLLSEIYKEMLALARISGTQVVVHGLPGGEAPRGMEVMVAPADSMSSLALRHEELQRSEVQRLERLAHRSTQAL